MAEYAIHRGGSSTDSSNGSSLATQSWYWGSLDKEEATRILMAKQHGHFLVRDSATSGEYTLVVRRKEKVRNIRILRGKWGGYGVVAHKCDFGDVADLIMYLMDNPRILHQHYAGIDLVYPVSKPETGSEATTFELLNQLVLRNKDLLLQNEEYINHVRRRKVTIKELERSKSTVASLQVVLSLFEEQLFIQNAELSGEVMKPTGADTDPEIESLNENRRTVVSRLTTVQAHLQREEQNQKDLESDIYRQLEQVHQLRAILSQIQQEVTFLRLRVEEKGLAKEYLDHLLKEEKATDLSHYDPSNWKVQCDRQEAERQLADRIPGTFLVRPGRDGGHALSIVVAIDDRVEPRHCLIYKDPQTFQYGFHPEYCIFMSLEELVMKHQTITLKYYNSRLDVCLTYPINYRRRSIPDDPRIST